MRVTSGSCDGEEVILRGQVLEVRNVDGRLHIATKPRRHDDWDPKTRRRGAIAARGSIACCPNPLLLRVSSLALPDS
jgi:hypothetical protein